MRWLRLLCGIVGCIIVYVFSVIFVLFVIVKSILCIICFLYIFSFKVFLSLLSLYKYEYIQYLYFRQVEFVNNLLVLVCKYVVQNYLIYVNCNLFGNCICVLGCIFIVVVIIQNLLLVN